MAKITATTIEIEEIAEQLLEDTVQARSVVAANYKRKYAERALTAKKPKDVARKVVARSCGDWLAMEIAKRCIGEKNKLRVDAFEAILDANGIEHRHWNRTTKGWQGRLRMTGRLALQRVVAEADGELELPDGSTIVAPRTWVAKHVH